MGIDASVFATMGTKRKSFGEYADEYDRQSANALNLKAGNLNYQNALQAAQDEAGYRDAAKGFGSDTAANYNALLKVSPKHAQAYQKSVLEAQKTQADIEQSKASALNSQANAQNTFMKTYESKVALPLKILQSATTPQQVAQMTQQAVQAGIWTPEEAQKNVAGMPMDGNFDQWRQGQLVQGMEMKQQIELQIRQAQQAETQRHNQATEGLTEKGQRQALQIAQMNNERQRENNATARENAATNRQLAADAKKVAADEKAVTKYSDTLQKEGIPELETAVGGAEAVMNKYKKGEVPGIGALKNALPAAAMSDEGKDVRQALAQVRNIVLSARSGAAVTDQELRRLVEEIGTGVGMSEDDIRRGLGRVRARLETIKSNAAAGVSDEVKSTYEERGGVKVQRGGAKPSASGGWSVVEVK
jgi:hypothetical protein